MKTYWIGRRPEMDIRLNHDTLSGLHAELVTTDDGRFFLTDCGSTNGTFLMEGGQWQAIRQTFVSADENIMLGEYRTTPRQLLARTNASPAPHQPAKTSHYIRDPATGEIIREP